MDDEHLTPLDPEVARILTRERTNLSAPEASRAAVLARLGGTVAGLASAPSTAPRPPSMPSAAAGGSTILAGSIGGKAIALAALTFAVGGVTGAAIHAALAPRPVGRVVYVDRVVTLQSTPVASDVGSSVPVPAAPASSDQPPAPEPGRAPAAVPPAPPEATARPDLARERALVDRARNALASGRPAEAVILLDEYARRYRRGQLQEESDALRIKVLAGAGRLDEARERAAAFRAQHPNSLLLPTVEAATGTIP